MEVVDEETEGLGKQRLSGQEIILQNTGNWSDEATHESCQKGMVPTDNTIHYQRVASVVVYNLRWLVFVKDT